MDVVRYQREEAFTTLNVDIRNHQNLFESLEQYVKGDLLEGANAYRCEKCDKKVLGPASLVLWTLFERFLQAACNYSAVVRLCWLGQTLLKL